MDIECNPSQEQLASQVVEGHLEEKNLENVAGGGCFSWVGRCFGRGGKAAAAKPAAAAPAAAATPATSTMARSDSELFHTRVFRPGEAKIVSSACGKYAHVELK